MLATEIIRAKRDGKTHTHEELRCLVQGYLKNHISDYHMAAWAMAVYFNGMTPQETAWLTELMWKSGATLPRDRKRGEAVNTGQYWIDKHSTGGVGDKTSLILVPLVSAAMERRFGKGACAIPMISGRSLGHTGGTLDKLSSVPGFSSDLGFADAKHLIEKNGFFMMGQSEDVAPVDKRLYALRDVTATVEIVPLIVASIMSKKLAENLDGIVLDVKFGSGAFTPEYAKAETLANALVETAKANGVDGVALLTSMDEPLGYCVGNQLEVEECGDFLLGTRREKGLEEVTLALAAQMVHLASRKILTLEQSIEVLQEELQDRVAFKKYVALFESQGGDWLAFERDRAHLRESVPTTQVKAKSDGYIQKIDAIGVGKFVGALGAGRVKKEDQIDLKVGVEFCKKVGDSVKAGDVLAVIFHRDGQSWEKPLDSYFQIGKTKPAKTEWVRGIVS